MKTIRSLSIALLLLLFSTAVHAQVGELRNTLSIGVGGGVNLSSVDFSPTIKQDLQQGIMGGATFRYTCEKYFSLICAAQLEVNYAQRGWKETIEDGSNNTFSKTTNYVEIPFFAHVGWGKEEKGFQFFVNIGPQLGYYLSAEEHYGYSTEYPWNVSGRPNSVYQQYGKEVENALEYGIAGGGGVEWKTSLGSFLLEGRYFFGLSDMYGNSKADPFGRSANTTITIKLSYLVDVFK